MRVRSCFVSNSSSSSFIVAVDKDKSRIKLEIEVDLQFYSNQIIKTIDELDHYFLDELYLESEELEEDGDYKKAKSAIHEGKEILIGSFSNEDGDGLENFLCDNGLKNNISTQGMIVIQGDGGY